MGTLLNFSHLDDLLSADVLRGLDCSPHLKITSVARLGPLVELLMHERQAPIGLTCLPKALETKALAGALASVASDGGVHLAGSTPCHTAGFVLTQRNAELDDQTAWMGFCLKFRQAAELAGLHIKTARGVTGAFQELESNIHMHSRRSHDGVVGYRATQGEFEFVIADSGIGALASLRENPTYADLHDHGRALELALTDGVSRFSVDSGHGVGFRDLFIGLANLNGELRFRSGDHALTIDGRGPSLVSRRLTQKADPLQGGSSRASFAAPEVSYCPKGAVVSLRLVRPVTEPSHLRRSRHCAEAVHRAVRPERWVPSAIEGRH